MKLIQLKCENCGADLNLNMDKMIAYCPYCGNKLLFDMDAINNILVEKEKTKQIEINSKKDVEITKIKQESEDKYKNKSLILMADLIAALFLLILIIVNRL